MPQHQDVKDETTAAGHWAELVELDWLPMAEGFTDRALRESDLCDFD